MTFDQFMVGGLLQETRIEKNITQAQMAEALDANTILLYGEKGNRRLKSIIARLSELDESDQNIVLDNFEYMVGYRIISVDEGELRFKLYNPETGEVIRN